MAASTIPISTLPPKAEAAADITGHGGAEQTPVQPLLIPAPEAARLCGVSEATWWRLHAAKRVPAAVKLAGRTLWRSEELRNWCEAGCPDRRTWEARRARDETLRARAPSKRPGPV
jgi:predicted DNA-binding transcriptional regulator AlpA